VSQPIAFLATTRVREGRLEDYKRALNELVDFVEANEPQLIAFNAYINEKGTEVTAFQVHPDSESIELHMRLAAQQAGRIMSELLETTKLEIYGKPSDRLLEQIQGWAGSGVEIIVKAHLDGFTRYGGR
jgi:hypothetical protein